MVIPFLLMKFGHEFGLHENMNFNTSFFVGLAGCFAFILELKQGASSSQCVIWGLLM